MLKNSISKFYVDFGICFQRTSVYRLNLSRNCSDRPNWLKSNLILRVAIDVPIEPNVRRLEDFSEQCALKLAKAIESFNLKRIGVQSDWCNAILLNKIGSSGFEI